MVDFVREHGSEAVNMLFTQFDMDDALEVRYEEGFEDGYQKGELRKLVVLVCRKLEKGKSAEVIAEELEEDVATISEICEVARRCGSFDADVIVGVI